MLRKRSIYDPVRRKFVRATPEEKIRQRVIRTMIEELGYPKGLIAVEKEIASLGSSDPSRRIDIVCYTPGEGGLRPLLIIECKAEQLDIHAKRQVLGYNDAVGAPFVALAGSGGIQTFWREKDRIGSVPFLPRFEQLLGELCKI